jgi:hypothetical protein
MRGGGLARSETSAERLAMTRNASKAFAAEEDRTPSRRQLPA